MDRVVIDIGWMFVVIESGVYVKISYARLYIISVQFKFIRVAYAKSLHETQSQDKHSIYPGKPLRGRKPNKTSSI